MKYSGGPGEGDLWEAAVVPNREVIGTWKIGQKAGPGHFWRCDAGR